MSALERRSRRLTVLIMAGGTGGHVHPALAVAEQLRADGSEVVWLGVREGLEAELVARAGIRICYIRVSGLRGRGLLGWLLAPFKLLTPLLQSIAVIRQFRPHVVLGMGGFVAGPGGIAAWLLRRPLLIHEQNAVPGFTNRALARFAGCIMEAFPGSFESRYEARHTGNPVRPDIVSVPSPDERLADRRGPLRLLVLGGSQGARVLNDALPAALAELPDPGIVEVRHQAGAKNLEAARARYEAARIDVSPVAYIEDMADAYEWADLVVSRSGAMTVFELAAAGAPSILVPFPHAVADEQTHNAQYLSEFGAAVLIPEPDLDPGYLSRLLGELYGARDRLLHMARSARARAVPDATARVVRICMEAANA